jgi:bacteriocin biosynthesis cyclodehydratase domain-containing protein
MLILCSGNFGKAVADRLQAKHDVTCVPLPDGCNRLDELLQNQDFVGVASWRPHPDLCKQIDNACFVHGIRWSMACLSENTLICGPLVIPGQGACYHCYLQRVASHHAAPDWERGAQSYYDEHVEAGPIGYPMALVEIAAAALAEDAVASGVGARLRSVDILGSGVQESEVIGIHRCPRCRKRADGYDPTQRFVADLVPAIKRMLNE